MTAKISKQRMREIIASSREKWLSAFDIFNSISDAGLVDNRTLDLIAGHWWTNTGSMPCSFCGEFGTWNCFVDRDEEEKDLSKCPLHDPGTYGCHPAWMDARDQWRGASRNQILLPAHILFDTALEILNALDEIEESL